jgi:hypothetical protein
MQLQFRSIIRIQLITIAISLFLSAELSAQIPTDSLTAYYPFNGNANDSSGNGNDGVVYGATLTTDRFGNSNSAYLFTGCASITIPELFSDSCSAFTFTAWVKQDYKDDSSHVIIYKGAKKGEASLAINSGILGFAVNLRLLSGPTYIQNWYVTNATDTLSVDRYYFVVGRYIKGQKIDLLINGIQVSSSAVPNLNLCYDSLRTYSAIGIHTDPGHSTTYCWNGIIDDIRVYTRALSDQEVHSLYHEGGWDTTNHAPIANAGPDQTIYIDSLSFASVTLDGSASSDKDGDTLTYVWKQADTTLATGVRPIIQLPLGSHTITLVVDDGRGGLDTDQVVIDIKHSLNGLVAYYPFNGNANDSSGNGYNATYINAVLVADRFGSDSSAYNFNGSNSTIQYGDILDDVFCTPVAKFSIVGWAKTRTYGSFTSGGGFIIGKSAGGPGPYQWNISHADGVVYDGVFSDSLAHNYIALTIPMSANQWFQFALVFDGSLPEMQRIKNYINSSSSNVSVYRHIGTLGASTMNTHHQVTIGASYTGNDNQLRSSFYDGIIDDIRIYNRPLTVAEIDSLYHIGGWPYTGVDETDNRIPAKFSLSQNYPNPFNPSTSIKYDLPTAAKVSIKVFNILGQEVMVLKDGLEHAGFHEVTFANQSLPSGIYFYRMIAGNFVDTKKMILMK